MWHRVTSLLMSPSDLLRTHLAPAVAAVDATCGGFPVPCDNDTVLVSDTLLK
jgi:hypothetical protein